MLHVSCEMHPNFRKLKCEERCVIELKSWETAFFAEVPACYKRDQGPLSLSFFSLHPILNLSLFQQLTDSHNVLCVGVGLLAGRMLQISCATQLRETLLTIVLCDIFIPLQVKKLTCINMMTVFSTWLLCKEQELTVAPLNSQEWYFHSCNQSIQYSRVGGIVS